MQCSTGWWADTLAAMLPNGDIGNCQQNIVYDVIIHPVYLYSLLKIKVELNSFSIRGETVQISRGHEERPEADAVQCSRAGPEPAGEPGPPKHVGYGPLPRQAAKVQVFSPS